MKTILLKTAVKNNIWKNLSNAKMLPGVTYEVT